MKSILIIAAAQKVPLRQQHPDVLHTSADSFYVNAGHWPKRWALPIGPRDTVDLGTDGFTDAYIDVITGEDTTRFPYVNLPYKQWHYVTIQSPRARTVYRLRFNGLPASYSHEYITRHTNQVRFEVPETFELANILWALSPSGRRAGNLHTKGEYYRRVNDHFKPYLNHPIFARLDFPESDYYDKYYGFRENSLCFTFQGDSLAYAGPYYFVMGERDEYFGNLFKELAPLVSDFARRSNYRQFYRDNRAYYQALVERQTRLMPVRQMWRWLEERFPQRYQSYKVVFSPLIGASHSTQQFWFQGYEPGMFRETVMFVSGPEAIESRAQLTAAQREGLASGVVFTEIDHNYVNRISSDYAFQIGDIFKNRAVWVKAGGDADRYGSPEDVFNEYMTHALFCLYALDTYDRATADFVIGQREELMVERRNYVRFREFNRKLRELYLDRPAGQLVSDLYPHLLKWAETVE
jgi:hypothetical protein